MRYTHDSWSIDLPNHWVVEETEDCVAMYDPDGVGAFQVSSYFKDNGDVSFQDLIEFSEVKDPTKTDLPYLNGVFKKLEEDGDSIFNWWLCGANHLVFATYVCETADENVEAKEREEMIHSLRSHYA